MALLTALFSYISYDQVNSAKKWPKVEGKIVSSETITEKRKKGTTHCPKILVSYNFNGENYTSDLKVGDGSCSIVKSSTDLVVKKYEKGKNLTLSVNPKKPNKTIIPEFSLGIQFYLMLSITIFLIGGIIFILKRPANNQVSGQT